MDHPYWPLFDLEVRTPLLTLRYIDDELAIELVTLAAAGIHRPGFMPFSIPWTDLPSPRLEREALRFYWRSRAETSPESWRVGFAVIVGGTVVGATDLFATDFGTLRQFETGSWLGLAYQGRGIGKEMRLAALTLGFDGFGARFASTGAWSDNGASLGVTRALGYEPTSRRRALRRDEPAELLGFEMSAPHFAGLRRDDVELVGVEPVRELLNLPTPPPPANS